MKKLAIFDLDGTLLNTIADLAHSTNYALNKLGYPTHEIEKYNFMVGNGINKLFERALPEGEKTEENVLRVRKEFIPYYDIPVSYTHLRSGTCNCRNRSNRMEISRHGIGHDNPLHTICRTS